MNFDSSYYSRSEPALSYPDTISIPSPKYKVIPPKSTITPKSPIENPTQPFGLNQQSLHQVITTAKVLSNCSIKSNPNFGYRLTVTQYLPYTYINRYNQHIQTSKKVVIQMQAVWYDLMLDSLIFQKFIKIADDDSPHTYFRVPLNNIRQNQNQILNECVKAKRLTIY